MLVYNIKRSINILGVSDLIAKLKMELTLQTACFVCITNYFRLKIVLQISYNLLPKKQLALETIAV
jgi:hypothetical protein